MLREAAEGKIPLNNVDVEFTYDRELIGNITAPKVLDKVVKISNESIPDTITKTLRTADALDSIIAASE